MEYFRCFLVVCSLILNVIAHPEVEIIGGEDASRGAYPFVVAILLEPDDTTVHCSGAIYDSYHVITAAQCLKNLLDDPVWIKAGVTELAQNDSQSYVSESYNYTYYPYYNGLPNSYLYDIGIIRLKKELPLATNAYLAPIQLPINYYDTFVGYKAVVLGWGLIRTRPPTHSKVLKLGKVKVIDIDICAKIYKNFTAHPTVQSYHLCAYANGTDHCNGDGGAPLALKVQGNWTLIGLASWGNGCAQPGFPGVYTNVAPFKPWVLSAVAGIITS